MGRRRIVIAGVIAPVVLVVTTIAAWAIDNGASSGQVLRNVHLDGTDVGKLGSDALLEHVTMLDEAVADRVIEIVTPETTYETTADQIGLSIDVAHTADDVMARGRSIALPLRPFSWALGFLRPLDAEVHFEVELERAAATLRRLEGASLVAPTEPTLRSVDGDPFTVVPGRAGRGIDPAVLAGALTSTAVRTPLDERLRIEVTETDLAPRLSDAVAAEAARAATEATSEALTITVADRSIHLVPRELRSMAVPVEKEDTIAVELDPDAVEAAVLAEVEDLITDPVDATVSAETGSVVVTPSVTGTSCCSTEAIEAVRDAFSRGAGTVRIDLTSTEPERTTEDVEALGIVEEIGDPTAFGPTTRHACCQNRVTNIHRIADLVRGVIIEPGETFSINDFVGRRTIENGFVVDGVIYDGQMSTDVGGGVSQFATTLFNAALYAGLEFGEYQSHSLQISRYPKGHEATISFPHPDLEIVNPTPHGVLIWPTYTSTSITVHLYSTKEMTVSVGEPTASPAGACTRWRTPRTRTWPDGRTENDSVSALYRPAEGVSC